METEKIQSKKPKDRNLIKVYKCPYCPWSSEQNYIRQHVKLQHPIEYARNGYNSLIGMKPTLVEIKSEPQVLETKEPEKEEEKTMAEENLEIVKEKAPSEATEDKKYRHAKCGAEFDELADGGKCPNCGDELDV